MKYILRLFIYLTIFTLTLSVSYVCVLRYIPVTITAMKFFNYTEQLLQGNIAIYSKWVPFEKIDNNAIEAVIASEDNNFLVHNGFDWDAIKMAIDRNKKGKKVFGASTISQQTAKNLFCVPDRSWVRKGIEAYYTLLIETLWSKKRIMEVYLNIIQTSPNTYGVEATAKRYFNSTAAEINPHQASLIAAVLPNPSIFKIAKPSAYTKRRGATIRRSMFMLPELDFDDPKKKKR